MSAPLNPPHAISPPPVEPLADSAPEVPPGLETLQTWDEPPAATGVHVEPVLPEDEAAVTQLVEEGLEEADRELRLEAGGDPDDASIDADTLPPEDGILS